MKLSLLCAILFSTFSVQSAFCNPGKQLVGIWKGEVENGQVIIVEFAKNGDYNLIVEGQAITCGDGDDGQIKYSLEPTSKKGVLGIVLYDGITKQEYSRLSASFTGKNQYLKLILYFGNKPVDQIELTRFELGS